MCAIVDGFQQFDATVTFSGEKTAVIASVATIQVTEKYFRGESFTRTKWVEHPVNCNVSISTTCTKTGGDYGLQRSFSVNNTVVARQLPFAEFNKEVTKSRPNDACVPFRTTLGVRGLHCLEYDNQPTLFSNPNSPKNISAEEFDATQAQQSV